MSRRPDSLFAFVDPKDPFHSWRRCRRGTARADIVLDGRQAVRRIAFIHTPQVRENALTTRKEVGRRHPECRVTIRGLAITDPKDYSSLMGSLAREVRDLSRQDREGGNYVCVSSGTAEMRAAWFLLTALGMLPTKLLQVGSPVQPLFGAPNVEEVRFDVGDWSRLQDGTAN
jgi:sigma54-dependent transcription regulator